MDPIKELNRLSKEFREPVFFIDVKLKIMFHKTRDTNTLYDLSDCKIYGDIITFLLSFIKIGNAKIIMNHSKFEILKQLFVNDGMLNLYTISKIVKKNLDLVANLTSLIPKDTLLNNISCIPNTDETTPRRAFGLPNGYIKLYFKYDHFSLKLFKLFAKYYNYKEVEGFEDFYLIPEAFIGNKKVFYFMKNLEEDNKRLYADYLRIGLEIKKLGGCFGPLTPPKNNLKNLHNSNLNAFNKLMSQKKALEDCQKDIFYVSDLYPTLSKYDFSDENFKIFAPKKITDLITEGQTLNHCVGGYIDSVLNKTELIFFLRKEKNIPYYTVNLSPDLKLLQVKGKYNCDSTKEIDVFIKKWLNYIKTNKLT